MSVSASLTAAKVVDLLKMQPHPEGGYYVETFRDEVTDQEGRAASTLIYFLLPEGVLSRWHKVDAVETWHWYAGAPLELSISPDGDRKQVLKLGNDLVSGARPQGIVPRHGWQQARSLGAWTLVGCTVAPGFQFAGFKMAPEGWEPAQS
ncbi:cupin domain-containing protein [Roseibium album]|uniref:cupin domain-containing protein n=1 Tax=Roseibium album TaxID=311410 RepID=UPI000CF14790|nr:cupin domain-containing protein [Roseibium album]MBG6145683.1 putative cupin superfamily sugar epimerase [Labrenzia sp. EL_142]MBG6163052.1 putative cupin superfamily sugar epimerase [Labrenzia sp. EL_195]